MSTYTYEVHQNIGTSGMKINTKYLAHIKNDDGRIVKTVYGITAVGVDAIARARCEKLERRGGTWLERAEAKREARKAAKAAKRADGADAPHWGGWEGR